MRTEKPDAGVKVSTDRAGGAARRVRSLTLAMLGGFPFVLYSGTANIPLSDGMGGKFYIPVTYDNIGAPTGLGSPDEMPNPNPLIFSSPLPSGSGARALGVAGAFTAVADDATAASWNPAGLTQLERPELSIVYRYSHESDRRSIGKDNYNVGEDNFDANNINYMSGVMPLRLFDRNMVVSLNYQEVFDFSQCYHANYTESGTETRNINAFTDPNFSPITVAPQSVITRNADNSIRDDFTITPHLNIKRTFGTTETLNYSSMTDVRFEQEGSVQAITPAFAFDVTPKCALGASLNVYQEGLLNTPDIRSKTRARYAGTLDRTVPIDSILYNGDVDLVLNRWNNIDLGGVTQNEVLDPWTDDDPNTSEVTHYRYSGLYEVDERISKFRGVNATLGSLLTVSEQLTLGFCLDLPWTARARRTTTTYTEFELRDENGALLPSPNPTTKHTSNNIEYEFPLYWALGSVWRWNNRLSTSFDVSQTRWSDYSFKEQGDIRRNPIDGSAHGEHPLDDCWSLRTGTEYLWVLKRTEIPLRAGLSWEQRPAIGRPDEYWGLSLGTGISLGKGPNKVIIDVAYTYTWANDVMGSLVPSESSLDSDVARHDVYLSCIYHF